MAKVFDEDAYNLGLLYCYLYSNGMQQMALLDDLKIFHQVIEDNLKDSNIDEKNIYFSVWNDREESIYFISNDKNNSVYYILKPGFNLTKAKSRYIDCLKTDVLVASQRSNALEALGLKKTKQKIKSIKK